MGRTPLVLIAAVALIAGLRTLKNDIASLVAVGIVAATVVYLGVVFLAGNRPKLEPFSSTIWNGFTPRGIRIMKPLLWVAAVNLFLFFVGTGYLGGSAVAIRGGEIGGHYYVGEHEHQFEVTRGEFIYSRIHSISVMFTTPLPMLAFGILCLTGDANRSKP
jgi:hypothetical protein